MTLAYSEIFAQRGADYHRAMLRHPDARRSEFENLFTCSTPRSGERLLDIPAGGGYLRDHLPTGVDRLELELTAGFGAGVPVYDRTQSWTYGDFDHIVCLAALHHIVRPEEFVRGLLSHLRAQGTLHLADVPAGSGIASFLDEFVGKYNITGHSGNYLSPSRTWFAALGHVARLEVCACPWTFPDAASMLSFCAGLFGLVDCPPDALHDALSRYVGVRYTTAAVCVDWQLLYVDLQRP